MSEPTPFNIAFEIWWSSADTYGLTAACKWTAWNAWLHQERTLAAQRTALLYCYEKLQPMQPFEEWVKEIGK